MKIWKVKKSWKVEKKWKIEKSWIFGKFLKSCKKHEIWGKVENLAKSWKVGKNENLEKGWKVGNVAKAETTIFNGKQYSMVSCFVSCWAELRCLVHPCTKATVTPFGEPHHSDECQGQWEVSYFVSCWSELRCLVHPCAKATVTPLGEPHHSDDWQVSGTVRGELFCELLIRVEMFSASMCKSYCNPTWGAPLE